MSRKLIPHWLERRLSAQGYQCSTCRRHAYYDLVAGQLHFFMHWWHPSAEFVNDCTAERHPGGGIDGRSCQPQHGCNRKLSPGIDRHSMVAHDVLVDQADP